jgi:hypothetical protein
VGLVNVAAFLAQSMKETIKYDACDLGGHIELKWIAGMFYWIRSVQTYDASNWYYMDELSSFVSGRIVNNVFIDAVSGIVSRGCHDPPCLNGFRRIGRGEGGRRISRKSLGHCSSRTVPRGRIKRQRTLPQ